MWGKGSKNYSEEVIKSYLCRHGSMLRYGSKLAIPGFDVLYFGALYFGGAANFKSRENLLLGRQLSQLIGNGKFTFQ